MHGDTTPWQRPCARPDERHVHIHFDVRKRLVRRQVACDGRRDCANCEIHPWRLGRGGVGEPNDRAHFQWVNVHDGESKDALQVLIRHPAHISAKERLAQWLNGYQVVLAEVVRVYGDDGIAHPLARLTSRGKGEQG